MDSARLEYRIQVHGQIVRNEAMGVAVLPGQDVGADIRARLDRAAALHDSGHPDQASVTVQVIPQTEGFEEPYSFGIDAHRWPDFVNDFDIMIHQSRLDSD